MGPAGGTAMWRPLRRTLVLRQFYSTIASVACPEYNEGLDTLCSFAHRIEKLLLFSHAGILSGINKMINRIAFQEFFEQKIGE